MIAIVFVDRPFNESSHSIECEFSYVVVDAVGNELLDPVPINSKVSLYQIIGVPAWTDLTVDIVCEDGSSQNRGVLKIYTGHGCKAPNTTNYYYEFTQIIHEYIPFVS